MEAEFIGAVLVVITGVGRGYLPRSFCVCSRALCSFTVYFAALKRGKHHVSLYLIIADRYPDVLSRASSELRARRIGRATFAFSTLNDKLEQDLALLLDRLLVCYRREHA